MIRRGFTIVELLIVITIMGILLVLGVVNLRGSQISARDAERKADIEAISLALEAFYRTGTTTTTTFLRYPSSLNDGTTTSIQATLRDLDLKALTPPGAADSIAGTINATNNDQTTTGVLPQPSISTYVYQSLQSDGSLCTTGSQMCETYNLFYRLESDNTVYKFQSKNRGGNPTSNPVTDPLMTGLLGWWPLNGNAQDAINKNSGAISGAVPTTGANGTASGAYSFDGIDDFIDLGRISSIGSLVNNFTVSFWFSTSKNSGWQSMVASAQSASNNGFGVNINNSNPVLTTYGVRDYTASTVTLSTNTWTYLTVAVGADNSANFYTNGTYRSTVTHTASGLVNSDDPIILGTNMSQPFTGKLDDVRIYDRVLSQQEITSLYTQGAE